MMMDGVEAENEITGTNANAKVLGVDNKCRTTRVTSQSCRKEKYCHMFVKMVMQTRKLYDANVGCYTTYWPNRQSDRARAHR